MGRSLTPTWPLPIRILKRQQDQVTGPCEQRGHTTLSGRHGEASSTRDEPSRVSSLLGLAQVWQEGEEQATWNGSAPGPACTVLLSKLSASRLGEGSSDEGSLSFENKIKSPLALLPCCLSRFPLLSQSVCRFFLPTSILPLLDVVFHVLPNLGMLVNIRSQPRAPVSPRRRVMRQQLRKSHRPR